MTNALPSDIVAVEQGKFASTGTRVTGEEGRMGSEGGVASAQLGDEQIAGAVARDGGDDDDEEEEEEEEQRQEQEQEQEQSNEKVEDVPPNGGYGWVCVACIATINGQVFLFSSFILFAHGIVLFLTDTTAATRGV